MSPHLNTFVKHKAANTDSLQSTYSFKYIIFRHALEDAAKKTMNKNKNETRMSSG